MLKVKWNLIPPQFQYVVRERASDNVMACGLPPVIDTDRLDWEYNPNGSTDNYIHELCKNEYEDDRSNLVLQGLDTKIYSRKEWEREQWKSAPEWAMFHVAYPKSNKWFQREPSSLFRNEWTVDDNASKVQITDVVFQYGEDWTQSLRKRPEVGAKSCDKTIENICTPPKPKVVGRVCSSELYEKLKKKYISLTSAIDGNSDYIYNHLHDLACLIDELRPREIVETKKERRCTNEECRNPLKAEADCEKCMFGPVKPSTVHPTMKQHNELYDMIFDLQQEVKRINLYLNELKEKEGKI